MEVLTTRFGPVRVGSYDRVDFPAGLIGLRELKRFVTIRDPQVASLIWLQSMRAPAWALALLPPRSLYPQYQVRATAEQLEPIQVADARDVDVYAILNRTFRSVTANLQAPLLINRRRGLGVQLVLSDSQYSVRHEARLEAALRQSA